MGTPVTVPENRAAETPVGGQRGSQPGQARTTSPQDQNRSSAQRHHKRRLVLCFSAQDRLLSEEVLGTKSIMAYYVKKKRNVIHKPQKHFSDHIIFYSQR